MEQKHYFTKDIFVVEGFDMVGKTTFIKSNLKSLIYHCNHDLTDQVLSRHDSWAIGYGVIDFLSQTYAGLEDRVAIDRGVFSSYVYKRLYDGHYLDQRIIDFYKNNDFFKNMICHIYIRHHSADTAYEIYKKSQSREKNPNELSNKFDQFNSFDDYWIYYKRADDLFVEAYSKIDVQPRVFETLPNMEWNEVRLK